MPRRPGRQDHTLLRDEQLQDSLLPNEVDQEVRKKDRATVFRLLGLAKKEAWVRPSTTSSINSMRRYESMLCPD